MSCAGGIYGFVRAFMGPFYGWTVACLEMVCNVFFVAYTIHPTCDIPDQGGLPSDDYSPLIWIAVYVVTLGVCLIGDRAFFNVTIAIGSYVIVILLIYIFGSLLYVDFDRWVPTRYNYNNEQAFKFLQPINWTYIGLQYLPLTSYALPEPKKQMVGGMVCSVIVKICLSVAVLIVCAGQYPGMKNMYEDTLPLNYGFQKILGISEKAATWLNLPGMFGSVFCFIWAYGRQLLSISKSGLLPKIFQKTTSRGVPIVSLLVGSLVSYFVNAVSYYNVISPELADNIGHTSTLSSFIIFGYFFISYIIFKIKYTSLQRAFTSPLGIPGALFGMSMAICQIVSLTGYHAHDNISPIILAPYIVLIVVIYFAFMAHRQKFSEEEKKELFKAYLISGKYRDCSIVITIY
jgi:ethanolamine permease